MFGILDTEVAEPYRANASFGAERARRDVYLARANDPDDAYDPRASLYWTSSEGWEREAERDNEAERLREWEREVSEAAPTPPTPTEELATFRPLSEDERMAKLRAIIVERNEANRLLEVEREARRQERESLTATVSRLSEPITDVTDERLAPIWDRAAEAAQDEGFCPEYDRLCDRLGIPGRERQYRGVVKVSLDFYAYATARGENAATDLIEEEVADNLLGLLSEYDSVDIREVEATDVSVY